MAVYFFSVGNAAQRAAPTTHAVKNVIQAIPNKAAFLAVRERLIFRDAPCHHRVIKALEAGNFELAMLFNALWFARPRSRYTEQRGVPGLSRSGISRMRL